MSGLHDAPYKIASPTKSVLLDEEEAVALHKAVRSHDPAVIILGCSCPLCRALRKLASLQKP